MSAVCAIIECMFEGIWTAPSPRRGGVPAARALGPVSAEVELLRSLSTAPPSAEAIAQLASLETARLGAEGRTLLLQCWERQSRWVAAQEYVALAAAAGPPAESEEDDWAAEEVAVALRLSPTTAQRRIDVARRLAGTFTATGGALRSGQISRWHATAMTEETADLAPPLALAVEARVLPRAGQQTPGQFRRAVRRAVATVDPMEVEARHAAEVGNRAVRCYPEDSGMAVVEARLSADGAAALMAAVTALAGKWDSGDGRTIEVRRADALVDMAHAVLNDPALPRSQRRPARIEVTVDLATLTGLADNPAELAGYGPIPASLARRLAADGEWHRLVTDPASGALLDYGRTTYSPPAALVDFLLARDRTCRFPGCGLPGVRCDIDHGKAWDDGGTTCAENCGMLCRRHHRLKTHTGWSMERDPDGGVTWTSPTGTWVHVPVPAIHADG